MSTSIKDHKALGRKAAKQSNCVSVKLRELLKLKALLGADIGANQLSAGHPAGVESHGLALTGKVLIGRLRPQRNQIRGQQWVTGAKHPKIVK